MWYFIVETRGHLKYFITKETKDLGIREINQIILNERIILI